MNGLSRRTARMSTTIMEEQLLAALKEDRPLAQLGCSATRRQNGGILVSRGTAALGVWEWRGGFFVLTLAVPGAPAQRVETVAEAVRHTLTVAEPTQP